ncbi:MAG: sigma-70 family RNA polymerase sigma factor [Firmicutes bacterium]|nr:sigma-70 family RNA polymerase sigma factor [Bacillota bacterium]
MLTETELIKKLKKGDEQAIGILLSRYSDRLLRIALGICGDRQVAEEVVQDTMLQACRKIHGFEEKAALSTWLYRITVNLAKNRLRNNWFGRVIPWEQEKMNTLVAPTAEQPEHEVIHDERRRQVLHDLQQLPAKYREVLVLYYLEDLSITQVSHILEQPEGTVKSKLSRGRTILKNRWLDKEGEIEHGCI